MIPKRQPEQVVGLGIGRCETNGFAPLGNCLIQIARIVKLLSLPQMEKGLGR